MIKALSIKPDGVYIDATFGRGGHSESILTHLDLMADWLQSIGIPKQLKLL